MRLDCVLAAQLERLPGEFAGAGTEQGDGADVDRKTKTFNHRGHEGTQRGKKSESQKLTADER
jgi:hypothetical protein